MGVVRYEGTAVTRESLSASDGPGRLLPDWRLVAGGLGLLALAALALGDSYGLERSEDGLTLTYTYDTRKERTGITRLLSDLSDAGLILKDVVTRQSSLEDIFVGLVHGEEGEAP